MSSYGALWLPTLVSAVAVFIVSSIIHMVIRWHASDQSKLPNEDAVMSALAGTPPGEYRTPWAGSMEHMKDPVWIEKARKGPMAVIGVQKVELGRGFMKALGLWFVYSLVVSYLAGHALHAIAHTPSTMEIWHTVGLASFLGYGMALAQQSIWGPKPWWPTAKGLIDSVIYAATTAAVFAWLWPTA